MKRRQQVLELVRIYKEQTGNTEVTSESLYSFLQSNPNLPKNISQFKYKTKRELAAFLRAHIKTKRKQKKVTIFLI